MRLFIFLVLFIFVLGISGCTNGNQSRIYQANVVYGNSNCIFTSCWIGFGHPSVPNTPYRVIEFEENGDLTTIPTKYGVSLEERTWLGKYQFAEQLDLFVLQQEDKRIEYEVRKTGHILTLQGKEETLELLPVRVNLPAPAIFAVLIIAGVLPLVGLVFWHRAGETASLALLRKTLTTPILSSILVGAACLFDFAMANDLVRYEISSFLLYLLLSMLAAALGIYLYAVAYHAATAVLGGKAPLSETVLAFYKWLLLFAIPTLYFQLLFSILSTDALSGTGWSVMQVVNDITGYNIAIILSFTQGCILWIGFLIFSTNVADARRVSGLASVFVLGMFHLVFEVPGFFYI